MAAHRQRAANRISLGRAGEELGCNGHHHPSASDHPPWDGTKKDISGCNGSPLEVDSTVSTTFRCTEATKTPCLCQHTSVSRESGQASSRSELKP